MKNLNPVILMTIFLALFFLGDLFLIFFLAKINKLGIVPMVLLGLIALLLGYTIYALNFGTSVSKKQEALKDKLSFTDQYLTVDHAVLQEKEIINWNTIEAIFLSNRPPLDGEYHNFEYLIILNTQPKIEKYQNQSWYNKISFLPRPKTQKYPIISINDHHNADFIAFKNAIHTHLGKNDQLDYYLGLKFGNETKTSQKGVTSPTDSAKPLKTTGFYKIFDRNNTLSDETLIRFRQEAQN